MTRSLSDPTRPLSDATPFFKQKMRALSDPTRPLSDATPFLKQKTRTLSDPTPSLNDASGDPRRAPSLHVGHSPIPRHPDPPSRPRIDLDHATLATVRDLARATATSDEPLDLRTVAQTSPAPLFSRPRANV